MDDTASPEIETLRRKRGHRRGQITRIQRRLLALQAKNVRELSLPGISSLKADFESEVKLHEALQDKIEDLMAEDESALNVESNEREARDETHYSIRQGFVNLKTKLEAWADASSLNRRLTSLLALEDTSTPYYRQSFIEFREEVAALDKKTLLCSEDEPIRSLLAQLREGLTALQDGLVAAEGRTPPSAVSTMERPTSYHGTKLKLDLPTFSGHPPDWHHFHELFTAALDRAGDAYSEREKVCFLLKAMQGGEAEQIVKSHATSEAGYTNALKALKYRFGSAKRVYPHLVKKVTSQDRISLDQAGFTKYRQNYVLPLQAMKELKCTEVSQMIAALALSQFDDRLREEWTKTFKSATDVPSLEDLDAFIEPLEGNLPSVSHDDSSSHSTTRKPTPKVNKSNSMECSLCKEQHRLHKCPVFLGYDVDRRFKAIKDKRGCTNCLSLNHSVQNCSSSFTCRECDAKHHTLLHRAKQASSKAASTAASSANKTTHDLMAIGEADASASTASHEPPKISFLHTAIAKAVHGDRECDIRMAFDTGAASSLITEAVASTLKLQRYPRRLHITGACGGGVSRHFVEVTLKSILYPDKSISIKLQVVKSLPEIPSPQDIEQIKAEPHLQGLPLADPHFGGKLDILLGGLDYPKCIVGSLTTGLESEVVTQPTLFGWTVAGPLDSTQDTSVLQIQTSEDNLKDDLSRLWELDRTPETQHLSIEDEEVTQHFLDTHSRDKDGRYIVRLPRIPQPPPLGTSRNLAVRRANQNEKSLKKKDKLSEFQAALEEYPRLDHAEEVPDSDRELPHYYMPVHGVFKASSTTTKVRPVFDASAPTSNGSSLNDTLMQGPNLYPQLTDILLSFRKHTISFSADISKMFREVKLHHEERDAHRFLLRNQQGQLRDMRMKRLTFGVRPSPYLATQVIRHLAEQHSSSHPEASRAILQSFYVDDYLDGRDTVEEAKLIRQQLCDLLSLAGMTLRKWRSNSDDFKATIPQGIIETADLQISSADKPLKALGLHWNVTKDTLSVSTPTIETSSEFTKRTVASILGKVFDLLGFYSPFTVSGKIVLRKLWELKIGWDEPAPPAIQETWRAWLSQLDFISEHSIPRRYSTHKGKAVAYHLHGFADASQDAYGVVVYLQQTYSDNTSTTAIIIAKARVLPLREISIPKAELTAAHLLAKLLKYCSLQLNVQDMTAWTDSSIVLCWLRKSPASLKTFVGNRVKQIQQFLPNARWSHIPSAANPADMLSRGMPAETLLNSTLWWNGPPWINLPQSEWPPPKFDLPEVLPEVKTVTLTAVPEPQSRPWQTYSSFEHMTRVLSWCRRFLINLKTAPDERNKSTHLSTLECQATVNHLTAMDQEEFFPQAFKAVRKKDRLPRGHTLYKFECSISESGVLLISTRVRDPLNPLSNKKLVPLSIKSSLTKLLLSSLHRRYLHPGTNTLLAIIKETYHIPGVRNFLKRLSRSCPKCQRAYQQGTSQPMGLLPLVRTTPSAPFLNTGVDFAGPFITKQGYTRKPVRVKSYACIFVCMATKAVHIELCLSLSTDEFLSALRRFCSRRGCPAAMYSDNGSNFIGAHGELLQIQDLLRRSKTALSHFTSQNGVTWHFSPPRTPHMGGLWEAAVKQMKLLLRKLVQPHQLRTDELSSVLIEIEGILNSRPLVPIDSTDPESLALTPGHFLVGRPIKALPTDISSKVKLSSLRRWQLTQKLSNDLWAAWKQYYLQSLHSRQKWISPSHTFHKDDIVLLKEDSLGYRHWPLARIVDTFPGDDGVVRVVELLCGGKTVKRSTHLVIPLLSDDSSAQE